MYGCSLPPAATLGWGGLRASLGTLKKQYFHTLNTCTCVRAQMIRGYLCALLLYSPEGLQQHVLQPLSLILLLDCVSVMYEYTYRTK